MERKQTKRVRASIMPIKWHSNWCGVLHFLTALHCRPLFIIIIITIIIQITHKQERGTHILSHILTSTAIDVCNSHKSGHLGQHCAKNKLVEVLSRTTNTEKQHFATTRLKCLGWRYAPYPFRTCAVMTQARGILPRQNNPPRSNPGTSNSDTWCISETKVSEHSSISYNDEPTVRSLRQLEQEAACTD